MKSISTSGPTTFASKKPAAAPIVRPIVVALVNGPPAVDPDSGPARQAGLPAEQSQHGNQREHRGRAGGGPDFEEQIMRILDLFARLRQFVAHVGVLEIARPAAEPGMIADHGPSRLPVLKSIAERHLPRFTLSTARSSPRTATAPATSNPITATVPSANRQCSRARTAESENGSNSSPRALGDIRSCGSWSIPGNRRRRLRPPPTVEQQAR